MTKNKSSLPAQQELPSPQDFTKNQTKPKRKPMPCSKFGKFMVETEKTTRGRCDFGTTKKRRGNATESRKLTPYVIRDLELKSEEKLRNKRKSDNWKRRQELKLKDNAEVLNVSKLLRKKAPKDPKKKTKTVTIQRKAMYGSNKESVGNPDMPVMKYCCFFCLEKRQQTSPAATFARFKFNRRYLQTE